MSLLFSDSAEIAIGRALPLAKEMRHEYVGSVHLMCTALEIVEQDGEIKLGLSAASLRTILTTIQRSSDRDVSRIRFSPRAVTCLTNAIVEARNSSVEHVTPILIVKHCLKESVTPGIESDVRRLLRRARITMSDTDESIACIDTIFRSEIAIETRE